MAEQADALVFFGASGDLAYKQIFPALYRMVAHGILDVPVIGVASRDGRVDDLRARARASVEAHSHDQRGRLRQARPSCSTTSMATTGT